jgi:hypothetical protein
VTVFCKSGSRATIAASLLDRAGVDVRVVTHGGAERWPEPLTRLGDGGAEPSAVEPSRGASRRP